MNLKIMESFYESDVNPLMDVILSKLEQEYIQKRQDWTNHFLTAVEPIFQRMKRKWYP